MVLLVFEPSDVTEDEGVFETPLASHGGPFHRVEPELVEVYTVVDDGDLSGLHVREHPVRRKVGTGDVSGPGPFQEPAGGHMQFPFETAVVPVGAGGVGMEQDGLHAGEPGRDGIDQKLVGHIAVDVHRFVPAFPDELLQVSEDDELLFDLVPGIAHIVDHEESAPGKVCHTFDEVMTALENDDFDYEKVEEYVDVHFDYIDSGASDRVIDWIVLGNIPEDLQANIKAVEDGVELLHHLDFSSLTPREETDDEEEKEDTHD